MAAKTTKKMLTAETRLQRLMLAIFALAFLGLGVVLNFLPDLDSTSRKFASGTLLKIGVVLGLAWISAPQLERWGWQRLRGTALVMVIIVIVLYAIRPRIGAVVGAVLIAGAVGFSLMGWFRKLMQPPRRS